MKTKKRILAGLSAFMMIASVTGGNFLGFATSGHSAPIISAADTGDVLKTEDGLEYFVDDDGNAVISGYSGTSANVIIPDFIAGYPVTRIADEAFAGNTNITNVDLGQITCIDSCVFEGCTKLKEIIIPNTVTKTGIHRIRDEVRGCFEGSSIETITFEEGTTDIPKSICLNAKNLKNVFLPEKGLKAIRHHAFNGSSIQFISIPEDVTVIEECAFMDCEFLSEVAISDSVSKIGLRCFAGCSNLQKITFGTGIEDFDSDAFADCTQLKKMTIPKQVAKNCNMSIALYESNVETLIFEEGTTEIHLYFSGNCDSLKTIYLPDSIEKIGERAFEGCINLEKLVCNRTDFYVGDKAFDGCDKLSLKELENNENYSFSSNTDKLKLNDIVNFTVKYTLNQKVRFFAKDIELQLDIPEGMTILTNSIKLNNKKIKTENSEKVIIPIEHSSSGELYFSAKATEIGNHFVVGASLHYNYNDTDYEQLIGEIVVKHII